MRKTKVNFKLCVAIICLILFALVFSGGINATYASYPQTSASNNLEVLSETTNDGQTGNEQTETEGDSSEKPIPPQNLGVPVTNDEYGINDGYLYQYLLVAYNNYYQLNGEEKATQLYTEMFKDFTVLDLSNSNALIKSLSGIGDLNLENLKVLNVGRNQIKEIDVTDLRNLTSLEELILYDNNLTELTIPTSLLNLKKLNLNKNYISKIDLSGLNTCEVYLSFNKIESINDITLPKIIYNTNLYVELFNNNILDADELFNQSQQDGGKITIELGLQGYGLNYKVNDDETNKITPSVEKSAGLKYYKSTLYPNMQVKIFNRLTNDLVLTINNAEQENKISMHSLPVGEYKLEFYNSVSNENMYDYLDPVKCGFKNHEGFKVIPSTPQVKFVIKGKEYDSYGKINGTGKLVATNLNGDGEMYYSVSTEKDANGNQVWHKGSEVELKYGGQYSVSFKCVMGDINGTNYYESNAVTKFVQQSLNPYIPDVAMLVLIVVVVVLLFFVALPLIIKYVIKR